MWSGCQVEDQNNRRQIDGEKSVHQLETEGMQFEERGELRTEGEGDGQEVPGRDDEGPVQNMMCAELKLTCR